MNEIKKVKKVVIPAAGLGTRFLPATKAIPKELLPIVDIPTIQYIVEEVVASGIETVILITGRGKEAIEDHFDINQDLADKLESEGKHDLVEKLNRASSMARIVAVRQGTPRGLGHAVLCAKDLIGDEPFAVVLGDDLVDSPVPCLKQLIDTYNEHQKSVVALMEVSDQDISKFGCCGGTDLGNNSIAINQMVEKPELKDAPSRLAIVGRYILTPRIFDILEKTGAGKGGEIQLTDAMNQLMQLEGFIGHRFHGDRFDAGDKFGFLKANIAYALKRPELAGQLMKYLKSIVK